jgi:hypothetical protein
MAKATSVCIAVDGRQRELFRILEKANGGLTLILKHAALYIHHRKPDSDPLPEMSFQRYSIHPSNEDPNGNLIHHSFGHQLASSETHYWTDAVKRKQGFALLFARHCPTLAVDRYLLKPERRAAILDLGSYDPNKFILCYAVFISHPEIEFATFYADWFRYDQVRFGKFRLVILITFLSLPSSDYGFLVHSRSSKFADDKGAEFAAALAEELHGHDESWCISRFAYHLQEMKGRLEARYPIIPGDEWRIGLGQYFAHASTNTMEYRQHARRVLLAGLENKDPQRKK